MASGSTKRLGKKLIVCCDGTWQNSDNGFEKDSKWWPGSTGRLQTPSNVTRIARAISRYHDDGRSQVVYYQAGVGTGGLAVDQIMGGATGEGLSEHIREAYGFLANNYQEADEKHQGDEIYLLGFSRGAFTARSIGGFIGRVGILTKKGMSNFYNVFRDYEQSYSTDWEREYRESWKDRPFESTIRITEPRYAQELEKVTPKTSILPQSALGIPVTSWFEKIPGMSQVNKEYSFHDTSLSDIVDHGFHALALDEKRYTFSPSVWENAGAKRDGVNKGIADISLAWMMSQLKDMITFDHNYLEFQYGLTKDWEVANLQERKERDWGLGSIKSAGGVMKLASTKTRTPGRYKKIDPDTRKEIGDLQDTNEYIHASVRVRMGMRNAKGVNDSAPPYRCEALNGWKISGVDRDGDGVVDREGDEKIFWSNGNVRIPEAELGPYEKELLSHFGNMAQNVMKIKPDGTFAPHTS
ncbi:hypothetical protein GP486_002161 [Trichoglossum hirsutum]|uniref:T6SS Phospholipase effector Tle1-like catalytic domain-containing protein n=1 Tax=Trichoglossum hirsutum TaxID=265104 RepID=A0A9P8LFI9_9PEZI|nr:hypothetical protein GP486_002161 [Trichoglossum hirsutum]